MSLTKVTNSMITGAPVNILDFGADPTGVTECSTAINAAMTYANTIGTSAFIPAGTYKISTAITPAKAGVTGAGISAVIILCVGCSAFNFPNGYVAPRQPCVIEKLSVSSSASSCDSVYAFFAGGVAASAAPVYNSGITVIDVAINNRFGGGFYFKDCFEVNVDRVVMTAVGRPVFISGSVVQSYFSRISAFGDGAPTSPLGNCGFETEPATYNVGTLTPEHITTTDCSWINYTTGVNHRAGLFVSYINTDVQTKTYGMVLNNPCTVYGGIMASMGTDVAGWVGIYMPTFDFQIENAIIVEAVLIQPLVTPNDVSQSKGIVIGDGVALKRGVVIDKCVFKGTAQLNNAIYSDETAGFNITNCMISSDICVSTEFLFYDAKSAYIVANKFGAGGGNIVVDNGVTTGNHGNISSNNVNGGSVTLTSGSSGNWLIQNNF